ncbi:MAG TPA: hypothetical protein VNJ47_04500 [Nevskiales bacterium]|nr:hypothetical protein [Nevskiales bacterium]
MINALTIGLCVMLAASAVAASEPVLPETRELTGHAYDRRTGVLLYSEHHYQRFRDGKTIEHRVDYRTPDGTRFATKTLDYSQHPYAPAFRTLDLRDGYVEGADHTAEGYWLFNGPEASPTRVLVRRSDDLVSDSGFDAYVRDHLPALIEGQTLSFRLAVAGRLADYAFKARALERERPLGRETLTIRVTPDSLLRFVVDPIDVTYHIESRQLLRYVGISNLRSPSGERYDTRIDFDPPAP